VPDRKLVIFVPSRSKAPDPRRRARAVNPLSAFARDDLCWCGSGRKYKDCHLIRHLSPPGAATPPDTDDKIFISPNTAVSRDAFTMSPGSVPFLTQQPTPQAAPVRVDEAARALTAIEPAEQPLQHRDIGPLRFALLDVQGINDPSAVRAGGYDQVLERLIPDLASGALQLARSTLDRLAADRTAAQPPVVLHSDHGDIRRIVGQTLLWADHYLTADHVAEAAASGRDDLASYRGPVADLLDLRPLIEAGIIVSVFIDLAVALIDTEIDTMVAFDLADAQYVTWAERQIVLEGPTAREAAFVHVIDDYPHDDWFYLHSLIEPVPTGQADDEPLPVHSRLLNPYDPDHEYDPWLATVRRQAVARLTQQLDIDLAVSTAFGADLLTTSPFRARALNRLRRPTSPSSDYDISGAMWADVPWLPDATADLLVRITRSEPRVEELRRATATALRTVEHGDVARSARAVADLAADLRSAASRLSRDLRRQGTADLALPGGLATGSVLVAGTMAPQVGLGGILAGAAAAIPAVRARLASRQTAAYAFWMARPR
jgi:hypothetical protein